MAYGRGTDAVNHWGTMQEGLSLTNAVEGTVLYSPAFIPPDDAALEAVTIYKKSGGQVQHGFGFWDHAIKDGWTLERYWEDSPLFFAKYSGISSIDGRRYIGVSLWRYGNGGTWPYLYNWQTNQWEDTIDDPYNPADDGIRGYYAVAVPWSNTEGIGWDCWELWHDGTMPVKHQISNNWQLQVHQNGVWFLNTPYVGGGSGWPVPEGYDAGWTNLQGDPTEYHTWWILSQQPP